MTRKEEIEQAANETYPTWEEYNIGFIEGAQWADKQEIEFLQSLLFQSTTYRIFDKINDRIKLLKGER